MKKHFIIISLLMSILLWSCGDEAEELPDWQVDVSYVDEAYIGETSNFVVKVSKKCDITLYVDGNQQQSVSSTKLNFDVSTLSVGLHNIKISINDGYGTYDKSYQCRIKEKPVVYQKPTITCHKVEQANYGESSVITASTKTDSKMTLYVDGTERLSTTNKALSFDVFTLSIGKHQIKIVAVNGDKKDEVSFNCEIVQKTPLNIKYEYVDLNLPSGTLWATSNVGAENPWDYGDYFAWGEVTTKDYYDWDTYKYCKGTENTMTKYCSKSDYGYNGYTDNLTVLEAEDDAATVNMGSEWRMPTYDEYKELKENCDWEWTDNYNGTGISGFRVESHTNTNNHIFLPAAAFRYRSEAGPVGSRADYMSSSLSTQYPYDAWLLWFDHSCNNSIDMSAGGGGRCFGQPVRAVRCEKAEPAKVEIEMSIPSSIMIDGEKQMVYCKVNRNCSILFYIDDNQAATEIPGTSSGFYWQLPAYHPGTHILTARAFIDGVVVAEKSLTYTVEAKPQPQYDYVDLGLPSGTLWATCNVGAENPWDYGDYFAWGETIPKEWYNYGSYTYHDTPSTLDALHDAATVNWGRDWQTPSMEAWNELKNNCEWEWISDYNDMGVAGFIVASKINSNSIFIPAAGYREDYDFVAKGSYGNYWSSTLYADNPTYGARDMCFFSKMVGAEIMHGRDRGLSVRPVRCKN